MTFSIFVVIVLCLAMIISGIVVLKKSAKKFNLTEQQLTRIKQRKLALEKEDEDEDN
jgi:uncharacterized protein YpmB|tara:strand:+ start:337 stop:507 length:171 start_codon:yes stop_codon:yes gene_type:complete